MMDDFEKIRELLNQEPHRVGPDAGLMFVRVDPLTKHAYIDKTLLAPLAQQGLDVDDYAARIEVDLRARGKWPE
jgi:hypothetical protein